MSHVILSVLIPAFNAEKTIQRLLNSLENQSLDRSKYETIVVDDGSQDDTQKILSQFPKVRVLKQKQQGPGAARNLANAHAKGTYILFLDADLDIPHDLLETHLNFHLENPHIAATGGSVIPDCPMKLGMWALADHYSSWFNAHPACQYDLDNEPEHLPSLNFCIHKPSVLDSHQLVWADGLKHTGEDVLFCHHLRERGLKKAFLPNAAVRHQDRNTLMSYLKHIYRYGFHAPFIRGQLKGLSYSFLFPTNPKKLIFSLPLVFLGSTFFIWKSWCRKEAILVTLCLPQIMIGRLAYTYGVARGTLALAKEQDTD